MNPEQIELVQVNTSDLKENPNNPNIMSKQQMEALKNSIREYGNLQPIVIDTTNTVIDGAHRLAAYKELGISTIPAIRVELKTDTDRRIIRQTMNKLRGRHDPLMDAEEFVAILKANEEKKLFDVSAITETEFFKIIEDFNNQKIFNEKDLTSGIKTNSECPKCGYKW